MLHPTEIQRIKELAGKDAQKEARLTAAACAMARCYAEYPEGTAAYNQFKTLADAGASDSFASERQLLKSQAGLFTYSTTGLFSDTNVDAAKQFNNTYQIGTRALGTLQAGAGTLGVLGSAGLCTTGVGCAAGAVTGTVSADYAQAGARQAFTGNATQPYGEQVLQGLGLSPQAAAYTYAALGMAPAAVEGLMLSKAVNAEAAGNAWARGTYTGGSAIKYEGTVYRYTDPKYANTTWEIHPGNLAGNHRYSPPTTGAVYAGTAEQTARAEVASYVPLNGKVLVSGDIRIERVLDLTDSAALQALGVTRQEITLSAHGSNGVYTKTQQIAEWARAQGYSAILAPSAQNKSGTNLITFNSFIPNISTGTRVITSVN